MKKIKTSSFLKTLRAAHLVGFSRKKEVLIFFMASW